MDKFDFNRIKTTDNHPRFYSQAPEGFIGYLESIVKRNKVPRKEQAN